MTRRVLFVSVEASGDDLAIDVIRALQTLAPDLEALGIGGKGLSSVGITSPLDVSPLGVVGLIDGLKAYSKAVRLADATVEYAINQKVQAVVLIDAWGFTLRVAQRLKARAPDIKVIKLIGPQVWATRPGRAKTLAAYVDHMLCIHEFEVPFYEPFGLPCTVIGNPAIARMPEGNGDAFRFRHGLSFKDQILLVLPGSRKTEMHRVAPVFAQAVRLMRERAGDNLKIVVLVSPTIRDDDSWKRVRWPEGTLFVENTEEKADVMSGATLALACSGTVTTELATQGCPMVVGYKLGWITWAIARLFLMKSKYITLVNIALGREAVPELVQTSLTVSKIIHQTERLLRDAGARDLQSHALKQAAEIMGKSKPPAHVTSANAINHLLST